MGTRFIKSILLNNKMVKGTDVEKTLMSLKTTNDIFTVEQNPADSPYPTFIVNNVGNTYFTTKYNLTNQALFTAHRVDMSGVYDVLNYLFASYSSQLSAIELMAYKGMLNAIFNVQTKTNYFEWRSMFNEDTQKAYDGLFQKFFGTMFEVPFRNWLTPYYDFIYQTDGQTDTVMRIWLDGVTQDQIEAASSLEPFMDKIYFCNLTEASLTGSIYQKYIRVRHDFLDAKERVLYTSLTGESVDDYMMSEEVLTKCCDILYKDVRFRGSWILNIDEKIATITFDNLIGESFSFYGNADFNIKRSTTATNWEKVSARERIRISSEGPFIFDLSTFTIDKPLCIYVEVTAAPSSGICLYKDTLITMADGSFKRIDEVKLGDKVKTPYGIEKIDRIEAFEYQTVDQYRIYTLPDGKKIKVVGSHRIWDGKKFTSTSKRTDLPYETVYEDDVVPYGIYTNKTNTYYADGVLCGTFFSNIKPRWFGMFLYRIRRLFMSKIPNKRPNKVQRALYSFCVKVGKKIWKRKY